MDRRLKTGRWRGVGRIMKPKLDEEICLFVRDEQSGRFPIQSNGIAGFGDQPHGKLDNTGIQ
jgi:hypothetical protein